MLTNSLPLLVGVAVGAIVLWLIIWPRFARLNERLSAKDLELVDIRKNRQEAVHENESLRTQLQTHLALRSAAEERAGRIPELESEIVGLNERAGTLQEQIVTLSSQLSESETRREEESRSMEEKLALLIEARQEFGAQFKNLANEILSDSTEKFSEKSTGDLRTILGPLSEKIREFQQRVEDFYNTEARERFSLGREVQRLTELNMQISQDAINLTNALKGQTKTQGDLGEVILESVLEKSGLGKGREYVVQKSLTDESGKRFRPDVIVFLPEERHLVIDSKINLPTYREYCELADGPERDIVLKKHIIAFRRHLADLNLKRYQDLYKLNSLDFVLMFIPFEGAFSIAVQADDKLFNDAFERNIIIVTPFTLSATIRTIANVWQREYQSRNALKIALHAGRLYDKFAAFVTDLEEIGNKLHLAQLSYDNAHNKLVSGRGNIISQVENMKLLGARAKKRLRSDLIEDAMEEDDLEQDTIVASGALDKAGPVLSLDEGGLFPDMVAAESDSTLEDSMPLLSSRSAGAGET